MGMFEQTLNPYQIDQQPPDIATGLSAIRQKRSRMQAHQLIDRMFGGMRSQSPVDAASARIADMFSQMPQDPDAIRAAIGGSKDY